MFFPRKPTNSINQFTCPNSLTGYFKTPSDASLDNSLLGSCNSSILVPVNGPSIASTRDLGSLYAALREGFELKWIAEEELCNDCRRSGGACGYYTTTNRFTCYCPDEVHGFTCNNVNGMNLPPSFPNLYTRFLIKPGNSSFDINTLSVVCLVF